MIKKIWAALTVAFSALALSIVTAAPAHADADSAADCPVTYYCFWTDKNYGGNMYKWTWPQVNQATGSCVIFSSGINNKTSSIMARATTIGNGMTFFDGAGGGASLGKNGVFSDNDMSDSIGGWPGGWNDRISSICAFS